MSTQQSLRKALGAIKDSTTVQLAKVNSDYKELDIAIVKATNHVECPPKEKHVQSIFAATSAARPRADVAYCIHALGRRLSKTHNWTVALKSLIVIHRILREGDPTFREELINYCHTRCQILNMSHFKDDSSPSAWEYSAWVRGYALFLEERLECFCALKYDVEFERSSRLKELDTAELLEQLPALQQLMHRLIGCLPDGAAVFNYIIQYALNLVLKESIKLYYAINDGVTNLVDKFFEMQRHDAFKALDLYKRAGQQTDKLSEFYEMCKGLDASRNLKFPPLDQHPSSFLSTMEDYVRDVPRHSSALRKEFSDDQKPRAIPALEYKKTLEHQELPPNPPPLPKEPINLVSQGSAVQEKDIDLLGLGDVNPDPSSLDESNSLALQIVPSGPASNANSSSSANGGSEMAAGGHGWELALVTEPSSNASAGGSKLAGGLDRLTLDGLYDNAIARHSHAMPPNSYSVGNNPFESTPMMQVAQQDPFFASNKIAPPPSVQMAALAQQQAMMRQQQLMGALPAPNSYGPYGPHYPYASGIPPQGPFSNNPFGNPGLH